MNSLLSKSLKGIIFGTGVAAFSVLGVSAATAQDYYADFGGKAGITALINTFVDNVANDPHINYYFAHTNIPALKYALVNQVCMAVGGPCKYTGPSMTDAHRGLQITTAAFNYLSQDMINAMDAHRIPISAQNYLLSILAPMEPQIVTANGPLG
ncbi:group 1 truncated hemoglobin [Acidithiobacillus sp. AMEEHan]|uniref:group I truncated hemoglobin n=1 Tax=Acidithiobacillus sp. AMEEHan TaxID=2994951 RepID=UPI0027E58776|nr:group 1 truncated hemoglobin [Acidithiobacillus sp. AMEEHan]